MGRLLEKLDALDARLGLGKVKPIKHPVEVSAWLLGYCGLLGLVSFVFTAAVDTRSWLLDLLRFQGLTTFGMVVGAFAQQRRMRRAMEARKEASP